MTERDLARAAAASRRADAAAEAKREARDDLVRAALAENWTHARIAAATGLTRGRVNQIARAGE